ncbi:MAG: glycerol-3-phosphate acyltransferase [Chloroflexi bacterium]|nr:glycerol-3-phosphate acyltransferase [Chloroflexota bacterium]
MSLLSGALTVFSAYLLGSIPFAYIITRLVKDADIRQLGDRNPGAANVIREVGIGPGLAVLLLDSGKGLVVIIIANSLGAPDILVLICGLAVVAGHMWSLFLGLRGGGGAATSLGVFFALAPREFSISFAIMVITVLLTRNFGFSVGVGLFPLPLILWAFGADVSLVIFSVALPLLLVIKNWKNWSPRIRKLVTSGDWKETIIDRRFRLRKRN